MRQVDHEYQGPGSRHDPGAGATAKISQGEAWSAAPNMPVCNAGSCTRVS
jgi:hypothetical protein